MHDANVVRILVDRFALYTHFTDEKAQVLRGEIAYMTSTVVQIGTRNAANLPLSSERNANSAATIKTLAELLKLLDNSSSSQLPMLRSTSAKIALYLGKPVAEVTLDSIYASREGFRPYLQENKYKESSIRAYVNYVRILLKEATDRGWRPLMSISSDWQMVLRLASKAECLAIAKFLSQKRQTPSDVTAEDTQNWLEYRVQQGIKYACAKIYVNRIWRILVKCGYTANAPKVYRNRERYGVPLSQFPPELKREVLELLRWKCADYEPGRPKDAKIRKVSALRLEHTFRLLYGYVVHIRKEKSIDSLADLLQQQIIDDYVSWFINERKNEGTPLVTRLSMILAVVSKHADYHSRDWNWFKQIIDSIPCSSDEEVKARKALKYLDYSVLEKIPGKIRAIREGLAKRSKEMAAPVVAEELLFRWVLLLPWRQRNVRECRIGGTNPNLFKCKIPPFSFIDKPNWVQQEEAKNPEVEFWQFRFSKEETKTGIAVHALVPRPLIGLLEEYQFDYRPYLVDGKNCDTLFVSPNGCQMDANNINRILSDRTLRHGGRRVSPHLFRDIVAFAWLKAHPKDYLTLSKMLWHKNIKTTIEHYGSRFNESSGVCAMEAWAEEREKEVK